MIRGKPVCPVLRGAGRSNAPCLPGELVGDYRNGGREWQPTGDPTQVNVYDFIDTDLGKAIPYGVYDLAANTGWVGSWVRPRHRNVRRRVDPPLA